MARGYVTSFDTRRGIGFVQHVRGMDRIPFTTRDSEERQFREGDVVEYKVTGGKAGLLAYQVRRLA